MTPPPIADTPVPAERIPNQDTTDYAYIRALADSVGFRFTLDPGPTPASSLAYWGPEPHADRSRPGLVIDVARLSGIDALQLRFDANHRVAPQALVLDPISKSVISIPAPDITTLVRPLGAVVPPAHQRRRLRDAAKIDATRRRGRVARRRRAIRRSDVRPGFPGRRPELASACERARSSTCAVPRSPLTVCTK